MGWDAFGCQPRMMPSVINKNPNEAGASKTSKNFKRQMKNACFFPTIGSGSLLLVTASYYKWTQWLFLKLYEKGLPTKPCAD